MDYRCGRSLVYQLRYRLDPIRPEQLIRSVANKMKQISYKNLHALHKN